MEEKENKKSENEQNSQKTMKDKFNEFMEKARAFLSVKRNKIITIASGAALVCLIVILIVCLTQCGSNNNNNSETTTSVTVPGDSSTSTSPSHSHTLKTYLDLNAETPTVKSVCTTCNETVSTSPYSINAEFDSVYYGFYPQTHVSDPTLIEKLNAADINVNTICSLGGYDNYFISINASTCAMSSDESKYDDGSNIESGVRTWFTFDPVEWKILTSRGNGYNLLSMNALDAHVFSSVSNVNKYETSEIRSYLTGDFYSNLFRFGDNFITQVSVDNSAATTSAPSSNPNAGDSTNDKIYLLSYADYNNTSYFANNEARVCKTTDYSRAKGAMLRDNYSASYWTRSPSEYNYLSCYVHSSGEVSDGASPTSPFYAIRPAITISVGI